MILIKFNNYFKTGERLVKPPWLLNKQQKNRKIFGDDRSADIAAENAVFSPAGPAYSAVNCDKKQDMLPICTDIFVLYIICKQIYSFTRLIY